MPQLTPQQWSTQLHEALESSNQRLIIDCAGDLAWCLQAIKHLKLNQKTLVLSDQNILTSCHVTPLNKSIQLLGQEFNSVVYDAFSGFDVDAFTRAIGLIKAPGLLILIRQNDEQWLLQQDKKNIWQNKQQGNNYFLTYLTKQLYQTEAVIQYHQNTPLDVLKPLVNSPKTKIDAQVLLSEQQQVAWQKLHTIFNNKESSIALLAARGRGKSTLLGRWLSQKSLATVKFIITSDSKKAAGHCLQFSHELDNVEYIAIDNLLLNEYTANCIIVDEAATIPVALLFELKKRYSHVIYTSTLDGYEGTGQGFDLQFLASFKKQALTIVELTTPMRWGNHDFLELWMKKSFMLLPTKKTEAVKTDIIYRQLTQLQLSQDEELLRQTFQLLKTAHYRSKASDIKMLLDNPDITVWVALSNLQVIAVVLLMAEGELDATLTKDIFYGKRRPQGHLLAQGLTVHAGCDRFAELKGFRIQRIAVAKCFRKQGIGSHLMTLATDYAKQNKASYIGTVFALDEQRLSFWQHNNMTLMMVSVGQGTSTGKPSITMLLAFDTQAEYYKEFCQKSLKSGFSESLLTHFKTMPALQVESLLSLIPAFGTSNKEQCDTYINGFKGFEYSLFDLRCYVLYALQQKNSFLNLSNKTLLIEAVLQYQPWSELIKTHSLSGKKELNQKLKDILKKA